MSLSIQPYKGTRDFYPEDKRLQKYIFKRLREVCELFGYEEYDAPVLEPTELYLAKGNEEIIQEQTYTFIDRGDRSVTLRTEMTPSVSRMVAARRQDLPYPLRWYSIPNLWRYERPQKGRLREFWQLNVDIFGIAGVEADQECIQLSDAILQAFGANRDMYVIRLNSRALMDYITKDYLGLDSVQAATLVRLIDRMHKLEGSEFRGLLEGIFSPSQREAGLATKLDLILSAKELKDLPNEVAVHPAAMKLAALAELLKRQGISNAKYDPTLMRGFDYYTDIVFEVFDTDPDNNRSMFGGGRYDGLVGQFGVEPVPTFGFGMGDVTLQNFLESHDLLPQLHSDTDIYVILVGEVYERALAAVNKLREMGVKVAVDTTGRKADKQIKTALKKRIPYLMFIGEQELENDQFKLKHLDRNTEETHSIERIVSIVKDHRHKSTPK
jgi:histidyl-tRNA synthetase